MALGRARRWEPGSQPSPPSRCSWPRRVDSANGQYSAMDVNAHIYEFAPKFKQLVSHTWKDAVGWNHGDPHHR
eukprot:8360159-Pyramimonas_sp.AAC.1